MGGHGRFRRHLESRIEWIDMPIELRKRYQSYTRADVSKLRAAGYERPFLRPDEGIDAYAQSAEVTNVGTV